MKILVINPGSTSTKIAVYDGKKELFNKNINHSTEKISEFKFVIDQLEWRQEVIKEKIDKANFNLEEFSAIVARGGAGLDPISGGTYKVDENMVEDLYKNKNAEHASNLAGIIAYNLAETYNLNCYTVDPVSVDEFEPLARLSGVPEINRKCQSHALNLKALTRKTADKLDEKKENINLVGVHLGGGISIAAIKKGKIIDVNNANQNGPYSPERCGTLPVLDLIEYIYNNDFEGKELEKKLINKSGLMGYLGINDGKEIERQIKNGDKKAKLVYDGMIYQIAKEIGAMASVLNGKVNAIFITGGLANSKYIVEKLTEKIDYISTVFIFPGSDEIQNLAKGAYRVLNNEEKAKIYKEEIIELGDIL